MKHAGSGDRWSPLLFLRISALLCLISAFSVHGFGGDNAAKTKQINEFQDYALHQDNASECTYLVLPNQQGDNYTHTHFIVGMIRKYPVLIVAKTNKERVDEFKNCSEILKGSDSANGMQAYENFLGPDSKFYIHSLDAISEFVDVENTARYNSETDTVNKTLQVYNLDWNRIGLKKDTKRWSFTFQGTEKEGSNPKFFNEEGSVTLTITIHNENSIQDQTPHLSVVPSSASVKISIDGFDVIGHQSRLLTKMNIISSDSLTQTNKTLRYVSDQNAPGIFESTSVKIEQASKPGYIAEYFVQSCYTEDARPYFSKVKLETYTTDQVSNIAEMVRTIPEILDPLRFEPETKDEVAETNSDLPKNVATTTLFNEPFIFSCGNDRDGGYKHTGFTTFTFVLTYDKELRPHTSQKGIYISFGVASCISITTIVLAFMFVRKRPTTMDNAEVDKMNSQENENKKLLDHVPPVHLMGGQSA